MTKSRKTKIINVQPGYSIEIVEPDWPAILTDLLKTRTQRALAEELSTTQKQVWNWLHDVNSPTGLYKKVLLEM